MLMGLQFPAVVHHSPSLFSLSLVVSDDATPSAAKQRPSSVRHSRIIVEHRSYRKSIGEYGSLLHQAHLQSLSNTSSIPPSTPPRQAPPPPGPSSLKAQDPLSPTTAPAHKLSFTTNGTSTTRARSKGKGGVLRFVSGLVGWNKRVEISTPQDPVHLTHVMFNTSTREFTGLPKEWRQLLGKSGISRAEQKKNSEAVMEIVKFYNEGGGDVQDRMGGVLKGGPPVLPAPPVNKPLMDESFYVPMPASGSPTWPQQPASTTQPITESACRRLIRRAFAPHELSSLIDEALSKEDGTGSNCSLTADDAQKLIDVTDEILDTHDLLHWVRKNCLRLLYRTCGHHARLPSALAVPVSYDRTGDALYRGGYGDVWKGSYHNQDVAVKVLRTYSGDELQKVVNTFCKEVVAWRFLRHPNILPLIGILMSENRFAMVSKWMVNGNINQFVKAHPEVNRFGLLAGVAEGLIYLHNNEMVHGDLKGANILIDETGRARLADFGLLTIISDPVNFLSSSSYSQGGTARWMSPELIDPQRFGLEKSRRTISSDCYALGMVVYETISGNLPFHEHADLTVFMRVMAGEHPTWEAGFPKRLWRVLEKCWTPHPNDRPDVRDVLQRLQTVSKR